MPDVAAQRTDLMDRGRVMEVVADLAGGGLAERMRLDAATRILVSARRMMAVAPIEAMAARGSAVVLRVAHGWDPAATTAEEHVESLAPAELDEFLAAARRWAASVRDATRHEGRRAA